MVKAQGYQCEDGELLEALWYHYTMKHPLESGKIGEMFQGMEDVLKPLSKKRRNALIREVLELCIEYERSAFAEGVRMGGRLILEMAEEPGDCNASVRNGSQ